MLADVYLVFNQDGICIRTRLVTESVALYRSIHIATELVNHSKTLIDLGSQEPCTVYTTRSILDTLEHYDQYMSWYAVKVTTIII